MRKYLMFGLFLLIFQVMRVIQAYLPKIALKLNEISKILQIMAFQPLNTMKDLFELKLA
jgi:hypothetical protein